MFKKRVLIAKSYNPYLNLAVEDWILNNLEANVPVLYLWQNNKTVVIGRHQNVYSEVDVKQAKADGVNIARRQSGGGAVFHDLGNLNFTFLSSKEKYSIEENNQLIIKALKRFGIEAKASGRNDLTVMEAKISGSAFKLQKDRAFHHGTLLVNLNQNNAQKYLTPDKAKLAAKGVTSVKSRIANLQDFNPQISVQNLIMAILEEFGCLEFEVLNEENLKNNQQIREYYTQITDKNWIFNKMPAQKNCFKKKTEKGFFEIYFELREDKCFDVDIFSDTLNFDDIEQIRSQIEGKNVNNLKIF